MRTCTRLGRRPQTPLLSEREQEMRATCDGPADNWLFRQKFSKLMPNSTQTLSGQEWLIISIMQRVAHPWIEFFAKCKLTIAGWISTIRTSVPTAQVRHKSLTIKGKLFRTLAALANQTSSSIDGITGKNTPPDRRPNHWLLSTTACSPMSTRR